jgi:hypothetical protein
MKEHVVLFRRLVSLGIDLVGRKEGQDFIALQSIARRHSTKRIPNETFRNSMQFLRYAFLSLSASLHRP